MGVGSVASGGARAESPEAAATTAGGGNAHEGEVSSGRHGHFLWISFLAIDVTSHLEREVGRGARRNRRALDTACTLG